MKELVSRYSGGRGVGRIGARNLHLLQSVAVVCALAAVVDHLLDFAVRAGVFHRAVFVAASDAVVCLHKPWIPNQVAW